MLEPGQLVVLAGAVLALIGVLAGVAATRGKTKSDAMTALNARIDARVTKQLDDAWAEIQTLKAEIATMNATIETQDETIRRQARELEDVKLAAERKNAAFVRIFKQIAAQWPTPNGPDINPLDMAEVEDTLPVGWMRRRDARSGPVQAQPP
jgi:hypothetical protein